MQALQIINGTKCYSQDDIDFAILTMRDELITVKLQLAKLEEKFTANPSPRTAKPLAACRVLHNRLFDDSRQMKTMEEQVTLAKEQLNVFLNSDVHPSLNKFVSQNICSLKNFITLNS